MATYVHLYVFTIVLYMHHHFLDLKRKAISGKKSSVVKGLSVCIFVWSLGEGVNWYKHA